VFVATSSTANLAGHFYDVEVPNLIGKE